MQSKAAVYFTLSVVFCGITAFICLTGNGLYGDTDAAWHLEAGNLIRQLGTITPPSTWSLTAPEQPWINIAWLWDIIISYLYDKLGFYGPVAFQAATIGATFGLLYYACFLRSNNGIASFLSIFFVLMSSPYSLRALWISNMFLALLFVVALLVQHRQWKIYWWYLMPVIMLVWVNMHGAFIIAFGMLGAFGFQALYHCKWKDAFHFALVGVLSIAACAASPYSMVQVYQLVFSMLDNISRNWISEFQPTLTSWGFMFQSLYVPVFLYAAIRYKAVASMAETMLVLGFLLLALTCLRYWPFFYIFSAPWLAICLREALAGNEQTGGVPQVKAFAKQTYDSLFVTNARRTMHATTALLVVWLCVLFSPAGAALFSLKEMQPYKEYAPAIAFAQEHYPKHRFINDYGIGATMILRSGGTLMPFIDGRAETAFPLPLVKDFHRLLMRSPDADSILARYDINGAIVYANDLEVGAVLAHNPRWKQVYDDAFLKVYVKK